MKRFAAIALAFSLAAVPFAAAAEESGKAIYNYEELVVGSTTQLTGNFFTDLWGNASSDLDVRLLLHGYGLVRWDSTNGLLIQDPSVVSGMQVSDNAEGDRTFLISIYNDMKYSDGTPVTAKDYAFSVLLGLSPAVGELGGTTGGRDYILGASDYREGTTEFLPGVKLLDEDELSVTIDHDYLPYFFELGLLDITPAPIHVIAPGYQVNDSGKGVFLAKTDEPETAVYLDTELLRSTLLDEETGYCTHPSVTSGPYKLVSFDGVRAEFEINPSYKGDMRGKKPMIPRLVYTLAENETMIDMLAEGQFGLLNKVSEANAVAAGMELAGGAGSFSMSNYPRSGLGFLAFGDREAVNGLNVRKAIAYCLDKSGVAEAYEGRIGMPVDGWYGIGQWVYRLAANQAENPPEDPGEDASDEEKSRYQMELASYEMDLERIESYSTGDIDADIAQAEALLEEDGWTLDESGAPYEAGEGKLRHKEINGELVPLALTLGYPEGNRIGELLEEYLGEHLAAAGAGLQISPLPMKTVLEEYYGQKEASCDLLFLATNFDVVYDTENEFSENEAGEPVWNHSGIADEALYDTAKDLVRTDPDDLAGYCRKWIAFQERFAEVLPAIPVYSNVYFDFYPKTLQNYEPSANLSWAQAIVDAYLSDENMNPELERETEAGETDSGDFVEFDD